MLTVTRQLSLLLAGALCLVGAATLPAQGPHAHWICSTETARWQEKPIDFARGAEPSGATTLTLDVQTTYQVVDGFGGCFNELGWEALGALPEAKREATLRELFAPEGANFTQCRAPIGANDFSLGWYSLNETTGDYEMRNFSAERTREGLLPFIKAAMKYQPELGIWVVPWCPPSWMTTNGRYRQGEMKDDARTLQAYALYLSKFVQAWRAEGLKVYAIHPQNETALNTNVYPQCVWKPATLNVFLRDHLVPQLAHDGISIEVWLGTIVNENLADYIDPVLGDPVTGPMITGVGYQYGGQKALLATHEKYPGKKLAQTETECYGGANSWDQALLTFGHMIEDTTHFANAYFFWNMVLDESGASRWNWRQNSLVTVDRKTETVNFNHEFYSMKHFSATVLPGARRIAVAGTASPKAVAFLNKDGSRVVLLLNDSNEAIGTRISEGANTLQIRVPALSMNTVVIR